MMTLTVEASYDRIRQPCAAGFLVGVQLQHRWRNDVCKALSCVVRRAPSLVAEAAPRVDDGLEVVRPVSPVGAGALEDGHQ